MGKAKPQKKKQSSKKRIEGDDRFKEIAMDPLFKEIPRKERKVVVDERFQTMFTDDRFKLGKFKVDKRGRKLDFSSNQHLANLYDIENPDKVESSSSENGGSSDEEEDEKNEIEVKLDLARGEGNVSSSSEESEEGGDDDEEIEKQLAEDGAINSWGEVDRSVDRVEWASKRIAICNLDWDRLTAEDLLVVLNSFKPEAGQIVSVGVYMSDFGTERLEKEETDGPKLPKLNDAEGSGDEINDAKTKEMIRAYQLERLRYYYAVCECDSEETAIAIYEGCDGAEYETSGVRFDLRFVPEEMEFDESRLREKVSTEDVHVEKYNPKRFESLAVSNCNAKLTWDETNPERTVRVTEAFKEDCNLAAFDNLLAPPSDSDSEEDNGQRLEFLLRDDTNDSKLAAIGDKHLRVEWDSVCSSEANNQEDVSEVSEKPAKTGTPFQKYLEKRKQKRKERKAQIVEAKKQSREQVQVGDEPTKKCRKLQHPKNTDCMDMGDDRFSSLFTDSAFAIDKTHPLFKGGTLANQQVDEKRKRSAKNSDKMTSTSKDGEGLPRRASVIQVDTDKAEIESAETLVQKLKKKTRKHNIKT